MALAITLSPYLRVWARKLTSVLCGCFTLSLLSDPALVDQREPVEILD